MVSVMKMRSTCCQLTNQMTFLLLLTLFRVKTYTGNVYAMYNCLIAVYSQCYFSYGLTMVQNGGFIVLEGESVDCSNLRLKLIRLDCSSFI
jgi:hypothetical protein